MTPPPFFPLALVLVSVAALTGCASAPKPESVTVQRTADSITVCTTFARDAGGQER